MPEKKDAAPLTSEQAQKLPATGATTVAGGLNPVDSGKPPLNESSAAPVPVVPNTGANVTPGTQGAPRVAPTANTNPATLDPPGAARGVVTPDANTNPATQSGLGGAVVAPPREDGGAQTTIDSKTTTIHPGASLTSPVEPTGEPYDRSADIASGGVALKGPKVPGSADALKAEEDAKQAKSQNQLGQKK
jgi:hypothetical protein